MEILRIKVYLTNNIAVAGHADKAVMLPFTGECECPLFTGKILPGGVDTQRIAPDGRCSRPPAMRWRAWMIRARPASCLSRTWRCPPPAWR